MTKIGMLGDVHGNNIVVSAALRLFEDAGVSEVYQLGDFGFWPGVYGEKYLNAVSQMLTDTGIRLTITPGNHEDYTYLKGLSTDEDGFKMSRSRIRVAPRGHRWTVDGVSFVSLGGAPSVDRTYRVRTQRATSHPLWWPEEEVTEEDVTKTVEGGYADVFLAHDVPFGVNQVETRIAKNPHRFARQDLDYALTGRQIMLKAVEGVKPKLYFHGHYHFVVKDTLKLDDTEVKIFGLNADGKYGTCGILETDDLSFTLLG